MPFFYKGNADIVSRPLSLWSGSSVANLRDEFEKFVLGSGNHPGSGQFFIYRKMDRAGTRCGCWDELRGSSADCIYCEGESFLWSEDYILAHFTQSYGRSIAGADTTNSLVEQGIFDKDRSLAYLAAETEPETGDTLFRIRVNKDGAAYYPVVRTEKWRIVHAEDRREEKGRIAFFICVCERVEAG